MQRLATAALALTLAGCASWFKPPPLPSCSGANRALINAPQVVR